MQPNTISTKEVGTKFQATPDEIEPIGEGVWRVGSYMTTTQACTCGVPSCLHRRLVRTALQSLADYATSWERYVDAYQRCAMQ